jgi:hypothetical protein
MFFFFFFFLFFGGFVLCDGQLNSHASPLYYMMDPVEILEMKFTSIWRHAEIGPRNEIWMSSWVQVVTINVIGLLRMCIFKWMGTIHWMPIITQLWMNLNWVNMWFNLGNQFCRK